MYATPEMNLDGKANADRKRKVMNIMETYLRGHVKAGQQPTQPQLNEAMRFAVGGVSRPTGGLKGALLGGEKEILRTDLPVYDIPSDLLVKFIREYRSANGGKSPSNPDIMQWWNKNKGHYQ